MTAEIDDREIGYFLEHSFESEVGDYKLSGIVNGMIAKGFRTPKIPYFCIHEFKRGIDYQGHPDAQVLAAMLVARQLNNNQKPVYGVFIIGVAWNFLVLNPDNNYCISQDYNATKDKVFEIFSMIKAIKVIIQKEYL